MRILASALLALAVLARVAVPAAAATHGSDEPFDAKAFFEELGDRGG